MLPASDDRLTSAPDLHSSAFGAVNRTALDVLQTLCSAEAVNYAPCVISDTPAAIRREVFGVMEKLGFIRRRRDPKSDRALLDFLRDAMPTDDTALALIFVIRSLSQSDLSAAQSEMARAAEYARRAALSPL
jgi:hypothetical protein